MTANSAVRENSVSNPAPFAPTDAVAYMLILALSARDGLFQKVPSSAPRVADIDYYSSDKS